MSRRAGATTERDLLTTSITRLGIFGGSFDPVHYGHLLLAESCREQAGLDQVWFVPAAVPPHKQTREISSAKDRIAMLELALAGHAQLGVSQVEVERGGVSYTVETLQRLTELYPHTALYFLMGADSLQDLPTWRMPHRICELATPLVVCRGGEPPPDYQLLAPLVSPERLDQIIAQRVEMPVIGLSSSFLRRQVAAGRSIRFCTPRAVEAYIAEHRLYATTSPELS